MESKVFEIFKTSRANLLRLLDSLSLEELNEVPQGFNNSIIWNAAHMAVTQQLLCYKLSGNDMLLSNEFVDKYKKGSRPEKDVSEQEVKEIKRVLAEVLEDFEEDYNAGKLSSFAPYETSFGVKLDSIEEVIEFCKFHEGLHFGYILAQRRALSH